jgi:two-component system phosphate regulon sensor histidine kinase PhoR
LNDQASVTFVTVKNKKNSVTLILIVSSLVVVLVLQGLWLRGAYRDEKQELVREVNQHFRNTVDSLHDLLLQKSIVDFQSDTLQGAKVRFYPVHDSIRPRFVFRNEKVDILSSADKKVKVEIIASDRTPFDSTSDRMIKRILSHSNKIKSNKQQTFFIKLNADTLNTDSLRMLFASELIKNGIPLPVAIVSPNMRPQNELLLTDEINVNPLRSYRASVGRVTPFLLQKLTTQILFSIFSTLLTTVAFIILYRSLRQQQQLMELKNDFISNMTHELKTPISTVSVALEALKDFNALSDPKRTHEYLHMAQNELNRLTLLTDNVLKMTTLESRELTLLKTRFDLAIIVERILQSMKLLFEKHKANVSFTKEGDQFELTASEVHVTNVVYNLIDNALKYGGDNASIRIHLSANEHSLELSVEDNGIGIPKEYHKKIFEKFFRVPRGNVHNTRGYGLGLNYVAQVVLQHDSKIEVESEPNSPSPFR